MTPLIDLKTSAYDLQPALPHIFQASYGNSLHNLNF